MIQYLYPAILYLVPILLGVLIYVYRRRKNRAPKIVATLFILEKFKSLASSRQKFFPPLRFFLEVLLIAALLFGAAGVYRKEVSNNQEIKSDNINLNLDKEQQVKAQDLNVKINSMLTASELKIDKIPNLKLNNQAEGKTVLLYHRQAPDELPKQPALFILPPDANALLKTASFDKAQPLLRWQTAHPVLRYLNVPLLKISRGKILSSPAWGEDLIVGKDGALAIAGELDGIRYVFLGFELFPYEGKNAPLTTIITLNALTWLNHFPDEIKQLKQEPKQLVQNKDQMSLLKILALIILSLLAIDILLFRFNRA